MMHSETSAEQAISDRKLHAKLRPTVLLGGKTVAYYVTRDRVPGNFTQVVIESAGGSTILGVKMKPQEFLAAGPETFEIHFNRNLRLGSLASLLKAAHLILFELLGYRYALSRGGRFVGETILGNFFDQNQQLEKSEVLGNAALHFRQYVNMVRPVVSFPEILGETAISHNVHICMSDSKIPWALIVYLRTADLWHAVLVPVLDTDDGAEEFFKFLHGDGGSLRVHHAHLDGERWLLSGAALDVNWVEAGWN